MSLISLPLFPAGHPQGNFYRQKCQCLQNKAERGEPTTVPLCVLIGRKYRNLELDLSAVKTLSIHNVLGHLMGYRDILEHGVMERPVATPQTPSSLSPPETILTTSTTTGLSSVAVENEEKRRKRRKMGEHGVIITRLLVYTSRFDN